VPAAPVPGAPCGWIRRDRNQCPTAPAPISTGKDPPRLNQQKRKSQSERPAPSALAFLLPAARPDQHREGLPPPRSAQGRTAPPTVTTCPICPAWAVTACLMSSGPPARSPARATPSSGTRRRPDDPAALLPAPLPDPTDNASR